MKAKKFKGMVIQYHEKDGYGFVTPSDNSSNGSKREVLFQISDLDADSVSVGDELKFSIIKTDEGFKAKNPTRIDTASSGDNPQRPTTTPGNRNKFSNSKSTVEMGGCKGTVTKYFDEHGYGFVSTSDISRKNNERKFHTTDVFFHISDLDVNGVSEGDRLKFGVVETDDGLRATRPTITKRCDSNKNTNNTRTDPAKRLGASGPKDNTEYGRNSPTTSGDVKSFDDERKFR